MDQNCFKSPPPQSKSLVCFSLQVIIWSSISWGIFVTIRWPNSTSINILYIVDTTTSFDIAGTLTISFSKVVNSKENWSCKKLLGHWCLVWGRIGKSIERRTLILRSDIFFGKNLLDWKYRLFGPNRIALNKTKFRFFVIICLIQCNSITAKQSIFLIRQLTEKSAVCITPLLKWDT